MANTIEASLLNSISALFASFSQLLTKMFTDVKDKGYEVRDGKPGKTKDGRDLYLCTIKTAKNHLIRVKLIQASGRKDVYDLYMLADNGKKYKKAGMYLKDVKGSDELADEIQKFIEDEYGEDSAETMTDKGAEDFDLDKPVNDNDTQGFEGQDLEETDSSKKLQVTLSKVTGSEDIQLGPIYCNYDINSAYDDLQAVVQDSNVADELTEDPQIFEITQTDDEYDVDLIDKISECNAALLILKAQLKALAKLTVIKSDSSFRYQCEDKLRNYVWALRDQLDWLTANTSFLTIHNNNPEELAEFHQIINGPFIDFDSDFGSISSIIDEYCLTLEMYRGNFDEEVRELINSWLLTLRYDK